MVAGERGEALSMKWQAALAGALASAFITTAAFAAFRVSYLVT